MAKNYHKDGYSCAEVAQILHCTPLTVRNWVNAGKIQANMSHGKVIPGHKRTIQITRKQLSDFLKENFMRYDNEEYAPFIIKDQNPPDESESSVETSGKSVCGEREDDILNAGPHYIAHSLSELSGAWAHLQPEVEEVAPSMEEDTYMISINGRVALGNLARETCSIIFTALANDSHFKFDEITIKAMKGAGK